MNALRKRSVSFLQLFIFLASFFILSSCGGGGGGGGGTAAGGITYNGVTTQAPITVANANKFFSVVWNGGFFSSGSVSLSPATSKASSSGYFKDNGMMTLFKRLKDRSVSDATGFVVSSKNMRQATPVNDTIYGSISGTETITGSIDPYTMTGSLTLSYVNYNNNDGYTYDGAITFKLDGFDMAYGIITDATMSFTLWTIKSTGSDVSLSGSMRIQESVENISDTLTINMDGRENIAKDTFRFQNFVIITNYNSIFYPTAISETYSGRVYVGPYGYVDVSTTSQFVYSSSTQQNPNNGGPVILSGAGNSKAAITPISTSYVKIEVDADGDAVFESQHVYAWTDLGGVPVEIRIEIAPSSVPVIITGDVIQFTATAFDQSNVPIISNMPCTWISNDAAVATIGLNGMATGISPGVTSIAASVGNVTSNAVILTVLRAAAFGSAIDLVVGGQPTFVATGDLNGDGKPDLAVTNSNSNTVSILLGTGAGSFGTATNIAVGDVPVFAAIGDFNSDGKLDLAVVNSETVSGSSIFPGSVSVLLGTGTGSFGAAANYPVGGWAKSAAIGDFNGDGIPDLVVANSSFGSLPSSVSVLLGTGTGSFGAAINYPVGEYATSVAIGDFNGDGKLDLVVTNSHFTSKSGSVDILLGTGIGSFGPVTSFSVGFDPRSVSIGDFNGDGTLDLAVVNSGSSTVSILFGDGAGSFGPATDFFTAFGNPEYVAIGDFNGDGKLDLAVANYTSSNISILLGSGSGSFAAATNFVVAGYPEAVVIGDFNGDGKQDLAVAGFSASNISIFLNATL